MSEPLHLPGFLPGGWAGADFGPFREGVEIAKLHDGPPGVALLAMRPGRACPRTGTAASRRSWSCAARNRTKGAPMARDRSS
jgi:hypothetical protein